MTLTLVSPLLFVVVGLILWLVPWPPSAAKLSEVGRWTFLIAFSVWLGLFH